MQQKEKHESVSSCPQPPIVVVSQTPVINGQNKGKGYYADNLAFSCEDEALLPTRPAGDVYAQLSQPLGQNESASRDEIDGRLPINKWLFWRAAISGCLLAITIILLYLWIHVRYINPMLIETFKISPPQHPVKMIPRNTKIQLPVMPAGSEWKVDYDLPAGIPVLQINAKDVTGSLDTIHCPPNKFALALHLESDSQLAENWLKKCGHNVAYFRIDGNPTQGDVERLINYLKVAQFLPLRATLKVEKGGDLLDNPDFQKTRMSDEVVKSVEISGYVTPRTIEELVGAVPYAEELTIKGNEVCKSLRRSLRTSEEACKVTWQDLHKLHIFEAEECTGLYDLIYSCWDMPKLETLQIRKSCIGKENSEYIINILDDYQITRVDFADNTCFDETLQTYPYMCQSSH